MAVLMRPASFYRAGCCSYENRRVVQIKTLPLYFSVFAETRLFSVFPRTRENRDRVFCSRYRFFLKELRAFNLYRYSKFFIGVRSDRETTSNILCFYLGAFYVCFERQFVIRLIYRAYDFSSKQCAGCSGNPDYRRKYPIFEFFNHAILTCRRMKMCRKRGSVFLKFLL